MRMAIAFDNWLTRAELLPLVVRSLGVVTAALSGIFGIKVFLAIGGSAAPYLVVMVTWLVFLPLLQFGLGRPLYSIIRRDFVQNGKVASKLRTSVMTLAALAVTAICLFAGFAAWLLKDSAAPRAIVEYAFLAAGLAACSSGAFQRDYCYAVSKELLFESFEFLRRICLLAGLLALWLHAPVVAVALALIVCATLTQFGTARMVLLANKDGAGPEQSSTLLRDVRPDAVRFLIFSINELFLYNLPLLYFTILSSEAELVFIAVWTRLFQIAVLPMRMLVDARVNLKTASFHSGELAKLRRELKVSLLMSLISISFLLTALAIILRHLLDWLGAGHLAGEPWLMVGLVTWGIGNAVQHVYGTFTVSHGSGFAFALKASGFATGVSSLVFLTLTLLDVSVGPTLALMGVSYALTALLYRNEISRLIKSGVEAQ